MKTPALVTHFVDSVGMQVGKRIEYIGGETVAALISHARPGNARELQNLIERAGSFPAVACPPTHRRQIINRRLLWFPQSTILKAVDRALILKALEAAELMIGG